MAMWQGLQGVIVAGYAATHDDDTAILGMLALLAPLHTRVHSLR